MAHFVAQDGPGFALRWRSVIDRALTGRWPKIRTREVRRLPRAHHRREEPRHFLARLSTRASKPEVTDEAVPYVDALDRALLNRDISRHEADELVIIAHSLGLGRDDVLAIHRMYVQALCAHACADGVITAEERADLHRVGELLGLVPDEVERALTEVAAVRDSGDAGTKLATRIGEFRLKPGDKIVFTGEAPGISRRELEGRSEEAGLKVTGSVSRFTRLVVAADTDSLSGKARRARELGVPIVDVATFLRMLEPLEDK